MQGLQQWNSLCAREYLRITYHCCDLMAMYEKELLLSNLCLYLHENI